MQSFSFPSTACDLGAFLGGTVVGDQAAPVRRVAAIQGAGEGDLTYFADRKYGESLNALKGAVVLTHPDLARRDIPVTYVLVDEPKVSFARLIKTLGGERLPAGQSPLAHVDPTAKIAASATIAPFAYVGAGAVIGERVRIFPHVYIGRDVEIGDDTEIHPSASVLAGVRLGARVKIFSGTVLGSDGFGLIQSALTDSPEEMPQIGTVVVEEGVRIGAKCTIDRGTLGETVIGAFTKIDDQVHIAHNVRIGRGCVICGQVGIAGSVVLDDGVVVGGGAGISNGLYIGKGVRLGARAGVGTDIREPGDYILAPAMKSDHARRVVRYYLKLPEIWKRLKELEKEKTP